MMGIQEQIKQARASATLYCASTGSEDELVRSVRGLIFAYIATAGITDKVIILCSPSARVLLLKFFWMDNFEYLGTRIFMEVVPELQGEISTIPGRYFKETILLLSEDRRPVGLIEDIV